MILIKSCYDLYDYIIILLKYTSETLLILHRNIRIHTCNPMGSPCLFKPNGQAVAGRPNTLMIAV